MAHEEFQTPLGVTVITYQTEEVVVAKGFSQSSFVNLSSIDGKPRRLIFIRNFKLYDIQSRKLIPERSESTSVKMRSQIKAAFLGRDTSTAVYAWQSCVTMITLSCVCFELGNWVDEEEV